MDERLQQLWREFTAEPTIENYERLGVAYTRAGYRPRVIDIPARIRGRKLIEQLGELRESYICNLRDGSAIPADYFGDTLVETNHRIFRRAHQFVQRLHGGDRAWSSFTEDFVPKRHIVEHRTGWKVFAETFQPEALSDFVMNRVGIIYVVDLVGNIIGWHARMAQPFYPSPTNISENIFINCDDETKSMFRNVLSTKSRIHEESWHSLKLLFIDIITT